MHARIPRHPSGTSHEIIKRMNIFDLLDENSRPKAPPIPGATPTHRKAGKKLAMIHDMHIAALDETREMMEKVAAGEALLGDLANQISSMELANNYRQFGNLCGRECQFLDFHHTSEDTEIFPIIEENGSAGLKRVIERLAEEHLVVARLLENLAHNVIEMRDQPGPETFASTKKTFELLYKVVRSHFQYEQTELEEAIGFYAIPF